MSFRVDLDIYRGPLDLLLYLVRKHELAVTEISVAILTEQYLDYLTVLEQIDVDAVGDFLDIASTLIEMKSRQLLPQVEEEVEQIEEPREGLVERLLEYKRFKDAANILEEQSVRWGQRFPRLANDLPPRKVDPADQPIHEVELWDLVSAFGRVMRDHQANQPTNIIYDDTPINIYMERIHQRLASSGRMAFSEMFAAGMHKSAMIGVFLAVLELVRHHGVRTEQVDVHSEIWVIAAEGFSAEADFSDVDNYGAKIDDDLEEEVDEEEADEEEADEEEADEEEADEEEADEEEDEKDG
ncbi:segregation and condensation protein A [Lignipirellula cremea]|uniref:Segregation and condensation protein A n=1 Tax=Lignipirellula cremea TaxID=2528010 RepID=A0A518E2J9_9BACT|nr:segregation/condensation protein A [Lignipirellula cremea]QDU98319.1 Segregation and condensation protein A [Lignipirellula cremea]